MLQLNLLSPTSQNPKLLFFHQSLSSQQCFVHPKTESLFLTKHATAKRYKLAVKCRQSNNYERQSVTSSRIPSTNSSSASPGVGASGTKVFVGHSIYKGKAALTVEPKAPEFSPLESGAFKLSRDGFVLLQFAPAAGVRQYDWNRKQVFSLSVGEVGTLLSLGARDSCEFFHDPNKGKSDEGKVRKVLKADFDNPGYRTRDHCASYFKEVPIELASIGVQNRVLNIDESIYIPITRAEYAILISLFNYIVPYLLGWNAFANSIKPDDNPRGNTANPRFGGDFEWNR